MTKPPSAAFRWRIELGSEGSKLLLALLLALHSPDSRPWDTLPMPKAPADIDERLCHDPTTRADLKKKMQRQDLPAFAYAAELKELNGKRLALAAQYLNQQAHWSAEEQQAFARRFADNPGVNEAAENAKQERQDLFARIDATQQFRGSDTEQCVAFARFANEMKVGARISVERYWSAVTDFLDEEAAKIPSKE